MDSYFFLTEADQQILRDMVEERKKVLKNTANKPSFTEPVPGSSETYVVLCESPFPGLNSLPGTSSGTGTGSVFSSGDIPGAKECAVYRLLPAVGADDPYLQKVGTPVVVYNLFGTISTRRWLIVNKDKYGTWWVSAGQDAGTANSEPVDLTGLPVVDVVHVTALVGTGSGTDNSHWFCQRVKRNGSNSGWVISEDPDSPGDTVDYLEVKERDELHPRKIDTTTEVGQAATAVTMLYQDENGKMFIQYPLLWSSDTLTVPSQFAGSGTCDSFGNVSMVLNPSAYQTVNVGWNNWKDFPRVQVEIY